jgi:ArsR family transcriptional regulator, arsenate/arsenite/antimonite-responsive transcriptional repressor
MFDEPSNSHKTSHIVKILKTIGEENRVQIIRLLLKNDLCVGALARILNISKPAVSQHLKILREAGLVRGEKIGYWTHYRVEIESFRQAAAYLLELSDLRADLFSEDNYTCLRTDPGKTEQERRSMQMCKNCCEQPDKLKTKPGECTPEQIKECHGEGKGHPCECGKEE